MSTTIKRIAWAVPLVMCGWLAVMAGVMRFSDTAPAAVVLFPSETLLANLPQETGILGLNRYALTVANGAGTAQGLYGAGAWIVLPAGLTGCIPLSKSQRAKLPI